ncbi:MAG: hypothetical protein R3B48_27175 [Kofleriaceae bacterium]
MFRTRLLALALTTLCSVACSSAYADQASPRHAISMSPRTALAVAPERVRAPYDVSVVRASGEAMPTYARSGRYYVMGDAGERYVIRVTNPTPRRVEAVVSVDGLDVVDGESGDLAKRGYIVPPYGEVLIEGFRTSTDEVATFRFSSVGRSYASRKGKGRNVGVIAVAVFEERGATELIEEYPIAEDRWRPGSYAPSADDGERALPPAKSATGIRPSTSEDASATAGMRAPSTCCGPTPAPQERHGLGTEFGEQRSSSVSFTRFVRATRRPIAIAELRYNNRSGLVALGIPVGPSPDEQEIMLRETADPFPGDRFARPPMR